MEDSVERAIAIITDARPVYRDGSLHERTAFMIHAIFASNNYRLHATGPTNTYWNEPVLNELFNRVDGWNESAELITFEYVKVDDFPRHLARLCITRYISSSGTHYLRAEVFPDPMPLEFPVGYCILVRSAEFNSDILAEDLARLQGIVLSRLIDRLNVYFHSVEHGEQQQQQQHGQGGDAGAPPAQRASTAATTVASSTATDASTATQPSPAAPATPQPSLAAPTTPQLSPSAPTTPQPLPAADNSNSTSSK